MLYLDSEAAVAEIVARVGRPPVTPANPYWRSHATALADPDGYQLLLVGPDRRDDV